MSRGANTGIGSNGVGVVIVIVGLLLLAYHAYQIEEDVRAIIEDPNKENKPGEILKLAIDVSRYWPK